MTITQELVKDKAAEDSDRPSSEQPPGYDQIDEQIPTIPPLNLSYNAGPLVSTTVTRDQCVAHLKFIAALADLRDSVAGNDGLFGLHDPPQTEFPDHVDEVRARMREKRWAVYTARAVDRYTKWWGTCVPSNRPGARLKDLEDESYDHITQGNHLLSWSKDSLPPLDVLMVWHAHMLNPRAFLEDCIRSGKMSFWASGFPWETINDCIDNRTLEYDAGDRARVSFSGLTRFAWDNLHDQLKKLIECPACENTVSVPWTRGRISLPIQTAFDKFDGYADKNFNVKCLKCGSTIDHELLRVRKFRRDVVDWLREKVPMPGTLYNLRGVPESINKSRTRQHSTFPNRFIEALGNDLLDYTDARQARCMTVSQLRDQLESKLKDWQIMRLANNGKPLREDGVAFRRMMSHYWNNTGPFALDLVGAVIRQGTFVEKMDHIDWLHSPTVMATMDRLIRKYHVFFHIMASNPRRMAVPTLDVDLAWHTHQLAPQRYFEYSVCHTNLQTRIATFIDHDDKVDENRLSDGFEWTSKIYRKLTDGEIYSECTCWYCEAIRAPDLRGGPFVSSTAAKAREAAANLHNRQDISSDPEKNPHISAHNAVRADTRDKLLGIDRRRVQALKLRHNYEKARRRAEKRNRKLGKTDDPKRRSSSSAADASMYATPMVWGFPVFVPYYGPYMCDPCAHVGVVSRLEAAVAWEGHAVEEVDVVVVEGEEEGVEGEEEAGEDVEAVAETRLISHARL
ncbi:hypothetical protein IFM60648_07757 [Aspergillus lentulus]|uniref:Glycine-rich domain-containing protein 1 n=1 Tax=Aspergillus lentulus TaxID=293939 RepID=A0ABQ1AR66_ASPLE|nr:hypothetical protein IFM60648_07757 [Aspergillus lentulus]